MKKDRYGRIVSVVWEVSIVQNIMEFVATAARWDHPFVNVVDVVISREFAMTAIRINPPRFCSEQTFECKQCGDGKEEVEERHKSRANVRRGQPNSSNRFSDLTKVREQWILLSLIHI